MKIVSNRAVFKIRWPAGGGLPGGHQGRHRPFALRQGAGAHQFLAQGRVGQPFGPAEVARQTAHADHKRQHAGVVQIGHIRVFKYVLAGPALHAGMAAVVDDQRPAGLRRQAVIVVEL